MPTPRRLHKAARKSGDEFLKITIDENGIYRIDGETLADQGLDLANIDPQELRVHNNGGRPLPELLSAARHDSLIEIPIIIEDGGDGRLDNADGIYFWGQSVNDWDFSPMRERWQHYTNPYTSNNIYWLSWSTRTGAAKRLEQVSLTGADSILTLSLIHI